MPEINWEEPYCGEGINRFRLGTDTEGTSFIAVRGEEDRYLTDSREAPQQVIRDIKDGKADHLLQRQRARHRDTLAMPGPFDLATSPDALRSHRRDPQTVRHVPQP